MKYPLRLVYHNPKQAGPIKSWQLRRWHPIFFCETLSEKLFWWGMPIFCIGMIIYGIIKMIMVG